MDHSNVGSFDHKLLLLSYKKKLHIYKSNHASLSFGNDTVIGMVFFCSIKIQNIEMVSKNS